MPKFITSPLDQWRPCPMGITLDPGDSMSSLILAPRTYSDWEEFS